MATEIKVNDTVVKTVSDAELKVLRYMINSDTLAQDMINRIVSIIDNKVERAYNQLLSDWIPTLQADQTIENIPARKVDFVNYVTSRQDYKDKKQRDEN
jgi:hypothetical protein